MAFKAAFIAHVPDADPAKHRAVLETDLYKLFSVLVRDQDQAVEACRRLVAEEGVQSVVLCPGNTHADVADIVAAVGDGVSVSVAREDSPSMRIAAEAMRKCRLVRAASDSPKRLEDESSDEGPPGATPGRQPPGRSRK